MASETFSLWGQALCVNRFADDHDPETCHCTDGRVWVRIENGTRAHCARERKARTASTYWQDLMVLPDSRRPDDPPVCAYCGPGECRSTARTANGADVERFERIHARRRHPSVTGRVS